MPSVAPIAPGVTGSLMKPAAPHVPGGWTSPCAPGGSSGLHAPPPLQPLAAPVVPEVQNERSPCLAASIATVAMPAAAYESAISSMSARPRVRPWRKTIIGAHLPNGASPPVQAGVLAACGVAIRTWIVSLAAVAGLARDAPVAGSSALDVGVSTSRISSMLLCGIDCTTPNLVNAFAAADGVTAPGSAVGAALV